MQVNQPQVQFAVDGLPLPGPLSVDIENAGYFAADRFAAVFAIGAADSTTLSAFASLTAQSVTIDLSLGGGGFVNILTGQIDNIRIDMLENTAILSGRDGSAPLIDTEITESFVNQTSSQIAQTIAARHGFSANVAPTTIAVGQYYELDHARHALGINARATTEWSLLTWLAQNEGFVVSVAGTTLNFGPAAAAAPLRLTPQDFMTLSFDTATSLPASVTVKSWNTRNKMMNTQSAGGGGTMTTLIKPNLTTAQAASLAAGHLALLRQHGTILAGTMPGELSLSPGDTIVLTGTETAFDQSYEVTALTRSLSARRGFTQSVRAFAVD